MTKRTILVSLCLTLTACNLLKSGRLGLTGNDLAGQNEVRDDGSNTLTGADPAALSPNPGNDDKKNLTAQPPAAPDCASLFRRNEHVGTFHCADDYISAMAAFPTAAVDPEYYVYRGLSFLLAAPELSLGLNTFLGVFSVDSALPWTKNLYGENGAIELVARGLRLEAPLDASVSLEGAPLAFAPRYSAYVTSEGTNDGQPEVVGAESSGRLVLIEPYDAMDDSLRVQLSFLRLKAFDVTDGSVIDDIANCSATQTSAPCLVDDPATGLADRSHVVYRDPVSGAAVYFALEPSTAGTVSVSELGIASGEFITFVPTASTAALVFVEQTGCGPNDTTCTTAPSPRRLRVTLRSLVDRVTPIEIAAIQKGIAILAPLTGTSITADQLLSDAGTFAPGQFFSDFFASAVRSARSGSNLNDVYFAFLNISADLKKYVVDDLGTAVSASPSMRFVFPKEIFRTSQDLELTARELRVLRAATNLLSAAGEVSANALRIGGSLVTRELVWDDARDDIDYAALTGALNSGFMLVLDEQANAKLYRDTLSGQLGGVDDLLADISSPSCVPTTLTGCMRADFGTHYRSLVADLKGAVDAGTTPSTPITLDKFELANFTCSDGFPNTAGSCASIGATVAGTNGDFTFVTAPSNMPYVANMGALAFTSRLRAPMLGAGAPFVVVTLPNGAKRIDVSSGFFDTFQQHVLENAGMRVRSSLNTNVFVTGGLSPKPHGLVGDENALLREVVSPALKRAADTPLSRVGYLISL